MLIPILFGVLYMVLVLVEMYSFMQAHEHKLMQRERELNARQIELDKIEHWLDSRYERIERITNREIRN